MTKTIFFVFALISFALGSDLDVCIQNKLKLSQPVNHKTLLDDFAAGDLKRLRYAARSALQVCHPTFDIVAGQMFKKSTQPKELPSADEIKCFEFYLVKNYGSDKFVSENLDKSLANGFEGDVECDKVVDAFTQSQIRVKMPEGNEKEIGCMKVNIDKYMLARIKAKVMTLREVSIDVFNVEKGRFVSELREVSDELINCIVNL
jgi:hypothetical protein